MSVQQTSMRNIARSVLCNTICAFEISVPENITFISLAEAVLYFDAPQINIFCQTLVRNDERLCLQFTKNRIIPHCALADLSVNANRAILRVYAFLGSYLRRHTLCFHWSEHKPLPPDGVSPSHDAPSRYVNKLP
jgi:hypothetical protein